MKARRLWLVIPWALFAVLAIGWVIWWNVLASAARERLEAFAAQEQARGADMRLGAIEARGFPVLLRLEISDIAYAPAGGGWRVQTAAGALHIQVLNPQHVIFEARAPIALTREDGDITNISAETLLASFRVAGGALAQAGIEADHLVLDDPDGEARLRKLVLNVRPDPRDDSAHQAALDIQGLHLAQSVRNFEALGQDIAALRAAIVIEHSAALAAGADGDPLKPWRDAGGRLRVEALALEWDALKASGEGHVSVDEQRRLVGALALPIESPSALFRALAQSESINSDARSALTLLSAAFAQSDREFTLDVEAENGVLRLEGIRTRTLDRVY